MGAHPLGRMVCVILIAALLRQAPRFGGARAAMVTTETLLHAQGGPALDADAAARLRLLTLLRRDEVRAEFEALGVDPDEAIARAASLSDAELAGLLDRIDSLPVGTGICSGTTAEGCLLYGGAVVVVTVLFVLIVAGLLFLLAGESPSWPRARPRPPGSPASSQTERPASSLIPKDIFIHLLDADEIRMAALRRPFEDAEHG